MAVNVIFTVLFVAFCVLMFASDCLLGKKVKALEKRLEYHEKGISLVFPKVSNKKNASAIDEFVNRNNIPKM